jgi:FAD/FMN-containing dehydrogenase
MAASAIMSNPCESCWQQGEVIDCHRESNAELFHATCGGMGLTGIILDAAIKLTPLSR